jgi:hypothetical protein
MPGHHKFTAMRRYLSSLGDRLFWTRLTVAFGFLAGVLLSIHLWLSTRNYPLVPVVRGLSHIPSPLDYFCLVCLIGLLLLVGVDYKPGKCIAALLVLIAVLGFFDQCRWQPWAYQYSLMLAAIGFFYWKGSHIHDEEAALNMCRLIMISIYFYSGLQKINPNFAPHVFPHLFGGGGTTASPLQVLAMFPPFVEASIGIGLLTKTLRYFTVLAATALHGFILLRFGPLGFNYNSVIWPWNVAMIALLFLLFWRTDFSFVNVLWNNPFAFQKVLLLLVLIMPLFSFFGRWDSYLSWSLYSGNVDGANIFVSDTVAPKLPAYLQKYLKHFSDNNNQLSIRNWSLGELNVPPYPETRIYREIGADVCRLSQNSADLALYVREKTTLRGEGVLIRDTCFGTLVVR